jgi:hypothetical protein
VEDRPNNPSFLKKSLSKMHCMEIQREAQSMLQLLFDARDRGRGHPNLPLIWLGQALLNIVTILAHHIREENLLLEKMKQRAN